MGTGPFPGAPISGETQPPDSSIPPNWDQGVSGWNGAPFGRYKSGSCDVWFIVRTLLGPRRWGASVPVGPRQVIAFYVGNCVWQIRAIQFCVKKQYVLYQERIVQITDCGGTRTETVTFSFPPQWRTVRINRFLCADQLLETITVKDPSGLPCGEEYSLLGVPQSVKEAAEKHVTEGLVRGFDVPVTPPRKRPGTEIGPAPSPEEMERRFEEERRRREFERELRGPGEQGHTHDFPGGGEPEPVDPPPDFPVPEGSAD